MLLCVSLISVDLKLFFDYRLRSTSNKGCSKPFLFNSKTGPLQRLFQIDVCLYKDIIQSRKAWISFMALPSNFVLWFKIPIEITVSTSREGLMLNSMLGKCFIQVAHGCSQCVYKDLFEFPDPKEMNNTDFKIFYWFLLLVLNGWFKYNTWEKSYWNITSKCKFS